ncbi:hypothetical protein TDMWS_20480 [Thermodesulfomicrobium sp. WS]|nr:hypothetical protein TDMWS_20480 [Thermodesulfomicrobium sp. WS]
MRYPLEDLFRIRRVREERAEREVTARREEMEAARRHLARCREDLQEYRRWRPGEEDRLFMEIKERFVHLDAVEELRLRISMLRAEELSKERAVGEAEQKFAEARQRFEEARAAYRKAVQGRQKIEEHRRLWTVEARKLEEESADKELEDFSSGHLREGQAEEA